MPAKPPLLATDRLKFSSDFGSSGCAARDRLERVRLFWECCVAAIGFVLQNKLFCATSDCSNFLYSPMASDCSQRTQLINYIY